MYMVLSFDFNVSMVVIVSGRESRSICFFMHSVGYLACCTLTFAFLFMSGVFRGL